MCCIEREEARRRELRREVARGWRGEERERGWSKRAREL
jgi:hypothetical protein